MLLTKEINCMISKLNIFQSRGFTCGASCGSEGYGSCHIRLSPNNGTRRYRHPGGWVTKEDAKTKIRATRAGPLERAEQSSPIKGATGGQTVCRNPVAGYIRQRLSTGGQL
ncbi:hypothetical protein T4A_12541 [Trichinella pseudospiralis]|uniref:Uncharacterized protein n=1 Tax=Trichinella pseudospiralis TaxID=6337 RepID=A0A0V1ELP2_TRIPS|nr:hypothetical protein T4A_12541 [Trichinella pseudospiralis]